MNKDQLEKFNKWYVRQYLKCSVCHDKDFLVLDEIWQLSTFTDAPPVVPVVGIMCKNCGQVLLFNAIKLGLVENNER